MPSKPSRQLHLSRWEDAGDDVDVDEEDLEPLSDAERDAWDAVVAGDVGAREYQRRQGWTSPGTVSNLLARARAKVDGEEAK